MSTGLRDQNAEHSVAHIGADRGRDRDRLTRGGGAPILHRAEDRRRPVVLAFLVSLQRVGLNDDGVAVGEIEHEKRAGMRELGSRRVDRGGACLVQEQRRVVAPIVEHPVQHEAGDVGGDQRHLAGHAENPIEVIDEAWIGARPTDHLNDRIAPSGGEEVGNRRPFLVPQFAEDAFGR